MGIVGVHVTQNEPESTHTENVIIKKEVIAYDSPKVDYSQKGAK